MISFPGLLPRSALSAAVYPGRDPPASGQEASSNITLALNARLSRRGKLHYIVLAMYMSVSKLVTTALLSLG